MISSSEFSSNTDGISLDFTKRLSASTSLLIIHAKKEDVSQEKPQLLLRYKYKQFVKMLKRLLYLLEMLTNVQN